MTTLRDEDPTDGAHPFRWDVDPDPDPGSDQRRRRSRILFAAAALPWVVVGAILLRGGGTDGPVESAPVDHDVADAGDATAPVDPYVPPADPDRFVPMPEALLFGGRAAPAASDAAAIALLVARDWLGDVGPAVGDGRGGTGYVEHVTVEAVDFPAPGAAVVTVVAVVLEVADGAYGDARAVRAAVPVRLDQRGARPAGTPWWLPPPDLHLDAPAWTEQVHDEAALAEAGAALHAAGYRDVDVRELRLSDGWAVMVVAEAVAPGAGTSATHTLWLRDHLGRLIVAGWLPTETTDQ